MTDATDTPELTENAAASADAAPRAPDDILPTLTWHERAWGAITTRGPVGWYRSARHRRHNTIARYPERDPLKHIASVVAIVVAITSAAITIHVTNTQSATTLQAVRDTATYYDENTARAGVRTHRLQAYAEFEGALRTYMVDALKVVTLLAGVQYGPLTEQVALDFKKSSETLAAALPKAVIVASPEMNKWLRQMATTFDNYALQMILASSTIAADPNVDRVAVLRDHGVDQPGVTFSDEEFFRIAREDVGNTEGW